MSKHLSLARCQQKNALLDIMRKYAMIYWGHQGFGRDHMGNKLSAELKKVREIRGFSLREVERRTNISNAYLSQLEKGSATKPSPHILYKIAQFYGVPYETLMELAGYLEPPNKAQINSHPSAVQAALMSAKLSKEEEEKVIDFIRFLRFEGRQK